MRDDVLTKKSILLELKTMLVTKYISTWSGFIHSALIF